jgi:hypothetical protein
MIVGVEAREPKKWQIELMLQVTWWTRKIRTRPPHSSASSPPTERAAPGQPEQERDPEAQRARSAGKLAADPAHPGSSSRSGQ